MGAEREQIGEVLSEPVYRDQIAGFAAEDLHEELHNLFVKPLLNKYFQEHTSETVPTALEINQFITFYQALHDKELKDRKEDLHMRMKSIMKELRNTSIPQSKKEELVGELFYLKTELEPPGEDFAMFVLPYWKAQKHFYDTFGGGRLLWQDRGLEAFDAKYVWIKKQEKKGLFTINDTDIRKTFHAYWTTMDHGKKIINDKQRIKEDFLEPEWFSIQIKERRACLTQLGSRSEKICKKYKRFYK